nr:NADH-quinone oxidoreductase subunit F [Geothrix sp.]
MTHIQALHLCSGAGCVAAGAVPLATALREALRKRGLEVRIVETGCLGPCAGGPVLLCEPEGILYQKIALADADEIVERTVERGEVIDRLTWHKPDSGQGMPRVTDNPFFQRQVKIALRNCGVIDPLSIDDAIAHQGYEALKRVLRTMSSDEVIAEIKASGLRGRGGAGFLTALKWELCRRSRGAVKYVLCNGDEGDPGAFMDRSILEGDPH